MPNIDGTIVRGEYIDLASKTGGRLHISYGLNYDSGVELDRVTNDGRVTWRTQVKPLGVIHSRYQHEVYVRIEAGVIKVTSVGRKTIRASLELATGKPIKRSVHETKR